MPCQVMSHMKVWQNANPKKNRPSALVLIISQNFLNIEQENLLKLIMPTLKNTNTCIIYADDVEWADVNYGIPISDKDAERAMQFIHDNPDTWVSCFGGISRSAAIAAAADIAGITTVEEDLFSKNKCPNELFLWRCLKACVNLGFTTEDAVTKTTQSLIRTNRLLWQQNATW